MENVDRVTRHALARCSARGQPGSPPPHAHLHPGARRQTLRHRCRRATSGASIRSSSAPAATTNSRPTSRPTRRPAPSASSRNLAATLGGARLARDHPEFPPHAQASRRPAKPPSPQTRASRAAEVRSRDRLRPRPRRRLRRASPTSSPPATSPSASPTTTPSSTTSCSTTPPPRASA